MSFPSWFQSRKRGPGRDGRLHHRRQRTRTVSPRRSFLPRLEMLEDRTLLSTFNVLNLGDAGSGSLRAAILAANSQPGADVIRFARELTGTIALTSQLSVTDDLKIDGPGADRLTLSGGGSTRVFEISGVATDVLIDELTIADGMASGVTVVGPSGPVTLGGGILNTGARLSLSYVTLVNNQATAPAAGTNVGGGGIANVFGATLTVEHCSFADNRSIGPSAGVCDSYGGGIYNDAGSNLTVTYSTFTGNQATNGFYLGSEGGANASGSQATVSDSIFANNVARGRDGPDGGPNEDGGWAGGGKGAGIASLSFGLLAADAGSTLTVSRSAFTGNQALGGAGGNGGPGWAGLPGGTAWGGALDNGSAALTVVDSTFEKNEAHGGTGGNAGPGSSGGWGGNAWGGAISSGLLAIGPEVLPTLDVRNATFIDNRAIGGAGGNSGSAFPGYGGGGLGAGGGISANYGTMNVSFSRFSGNQAIGGDGGTGAGGGFGLGGGILCGINYDSRSTGFVAHCTLEGNVARGGAGGAASDGKAGGCGGLARGGGILNGLGTLTVSHTTLTANQALGGAGGAGADGGYGQGGGLLNMGTATLTKSTITGNKARGGAAGSAAVAGLGVGGGVYNDVDFGATISIDALTAIFGNDADEWKDCFGC